MNPTLTLQTFNVREIDEATAVHVNRFWNRVRLEILPDDPPHPLEEDLQGWLNLPDYEEEIVSLVWNPEKTEIIASLEAFNWLTEDNQHLLFYEIYVAPEFRRQGFGRQMLRQAVERAREKNRRLIMSETSHRVPAGAAFMQRVGAEPGLTSRTNQLVLAEFDRSLLARWQDNTSGRYDGFELGFWDLTYPEEQIEGVLELYKIVNDEPRENLELENFNYTREQLREMEKHNLARGVERWTCYLVEKATGKFCGFTEVFWNINRPHILYQGFTGVNPTYRGKNFGRLLKARMMERVLGERPQVTLIRTGNANSNRFMLAINNEMGFKPYIDWTVWQVATQKAAEYLES